MINALEYPVSQDQPLLRVEQVAERLNTSEFTVRRYLNSGALPGYKIQGEWRVSEADLAEFLRQRRRPKKEGK